MIRKRKSKNNICIVLLILVILINFNGCTVLYKTIMGREPLSPVVKSNVDYTRSFGREAMANVMENLRILDNKNSKRIPGTGSEIKAANFIRNNLESYGYSISSNQYFTKFSIQDDINVINDKNSKYYESYLNTNSSKNFINGSYEVVDLFGALEEDIPLYDLKGKIALIQIGFADLNTTIHLYEESGCIAILAYSPSFSEVARGSLREMSKIPVISIGREDGQALSEIIANSEELVKIRITNQEITSSENTRNLIVQSNENIKKNIIITANYDSIADDSTNNNASSVASLLKISQHLTKELPENVNVKMVFLSGSADSTDGINNFLNKLSKQEKENNIAVINLDSIGIGDKFLYSNPKKNSKISNYLDNLAKSMGYKAEEKLIEKNNKVAKTFNENDFNIINISLDGDERKRNNEDNFEKIKEENLFKVIDITLNFIKELSK